MKIYCDKCNGTIAHIIGSSMIEALRQGHKFSVMGKDFTTILSCPNTGKCDNKVVVIAENGKILLENLTLEEKKNEEPKDEIKEEPKGDEGNLENKPDGEGGDNGSGDGPEKEEPKGDKEPSSGGDSPGEGNEDKDPKQDGGGDEPALEGRKYTKL